MALIGSTSETVLEEKCEEVIRNANQTLESWYFHKNKREDANDFIQVRSMFRTWMYKAVEKHVGYGSLKHVELFLSMDNDKLCITSVRASERSGRSNLQLVHILNKIFTKLDYKALSDGNTTKTSPVIEGESLVSFSIDYNKIQSIKFN